MFPLFENFGLAVRNKSICAKLKMYELFIMCKWC